MTAVHTPTRLAAPIPQRPRAVRLPPYIASSAPEIEALLRPSKPIPTEPPCYDSVQPPPVPSKDTVPMERTRRSFGGVRHRGRVTQGARSQQSQPIPLAKVEKSEKPFEEEGDTRSIVKRGWVAIKRIRMRPQPALSQ